MEGGSGRNRTEKERDWKIDGGVVGGLTDVIQRIRKAWLIFFLFVLLLGCSASLEVGSGEGELKLHFLDVGQGDATLIQFPSGKWMLIDGGERHQGEKVVTMLQEAGVKEIDILVATHPDSDHIGGLPQVIQSIPVKSVYAPKVGHTTKTYQDFLLAVQEQGLKIKTAKGGIELEVGEGAKAYFVGPVKEYSERDKNSWSAVISIIHGENTFLLTGDATVESEEDMMEDGQTLRAKVLKVGHHGSDTSTGKRFLEEVQPEIAVISLGENSYGHPSPEVLQRLSGVGIKEVYRTDEHGTIYMKSDGQSLVIDTEKSLGEKPSKSREKPFVGSKHSDVYHKTDCPDAERIKPDNRVYFSSEEEAQEEGRRRSKSPCWDS